MRRRRIGADAGEMETREARFGRTHRFVEARRGLRGELLALRYELELLDEAQRAGSTPDAARVALGDAFTHLRAAERTWQEFRHAADHSVIVDQIDAARDALEASVAARTGRRGARAEA